MLILPTFPHKKGKLLNYSKYCFRHTFWMKQQFVSTSTGLLWQMETDIRQANLADRWSLVRMNYASQIAWHQTVALLVSVQAAFRPIFVVKIHHLTWMPRSEEADLGSGILVAGPDTQVWRVREREREVGWIEDLWQRVEGQNFCEVS